MLNHSRVLEYIKLNLGFPYNPLELNDEEILNYVKTYTIREFSHYMAAVKTINLNLTNSCLQVPQKSNEFYLIEPDNLEILNVSDVYFPSSNLIFSGHPIMGAFSQADTPGWMLAVESGIQAHLMSDFNKTWEFKHPNILRISPVQLNENECTVEIETMHKEDFSTITNEMQYIFMQLALADIQIMLGNMRRRYATTGGIKTPFGDIPVDTEILADGKQLKSEIITKLETSSACMNVLFEKG
jgi:hypothetical protein